MLYLGFWTEKNIKICRLELIYLMGFSYGIVKIYFDDKTSFVDPLLECFGVTNFFNQN